MSKDLVAKVGEYTNKDGEKKNRYINVGVILQNDNGEFALIDPAINFAGILIQQRITNPQTASDKVLVSIFDKSQQGSRPKPVPEGDDSFDDDLPF